ncbi:UvrD-like helicase, ATP-binding domain, P-loop containing nucleoside triphosphate hydrolase, partial [Tanacetum coccineum]
INALRREINEGLFPLPEIFTALVHLFGSKGYANRGLEILASMDKLNYDIRHVWLVLIGKGTGFALSLPRLIVEATMEDFVSKILQDFVLDMWYSDIMLDKEAPQLIHGIIMDILAEISTRAQDINLIDLLTRDVADLVGDHSEIFRKTQAGCYLNLELPRSWAASEDIIRFCKPSKCEGEYEVSEGRSYVENSKVSECWLLMKFYSLSYGLVNHLLLESEFDLPMEVADEQMDIISFRKSSFIIRRSVTRKTTILTMKLFKNEQNIRVASVGVGAAERSHVRDTDVIDGKWVSLEAMSELKWV